MSNEPSRLVTIALSANGLANIPRNVYDDNFTFLVGESRYECPSISAAFVSPRIATLQKSDPTIQNLMIETKDPHDYFSYIITLCSGLTISIDFDDSSLLEFLRAICAELWNRELYENIFGKINGKLTVSNVFDRIQFLHGIQENYATELSFCSSHFFEFEKSRISSLPFEVLSGIVSNSRLFS
jgi:hypothetical protein